MFGSVAHGTEKGISDASENPFIVGGKRHILFLSNRELLG